MVNVLKQMKTLNERILKFIRPYEITHPVYKAIVSLLVFIVCLNGFYDYIGIYDYMDVRPVSIHSSAQCQRASIALNYYEGDMNFFKPRVQKYSELGGVTGVEFPIIYYLDAIAYKLFGFNEVYGRSISLVIVSLGFLFFYLLSVKFLKSNILSIAVVGSAAFSPVLLFYSPNFMPDAPSMALVLASWYFFYLYVQSGKTRHIHVFLILSTLAALIKVVALISLVALVCVAVLDKWGFYKKTSKNQLFPKLWPLFIKTAFCIGVVISWYVYANWLAKTYRNETFSLSPVQGDAGTLKLLIQNIKDLWLNHYYSGETYFLLISALVVLCIFYKYVSRLLFSITFLFFMGNVVFVYFFLNQFINHDYYIISILPVAFFLLLTMVDAIVRFSDQYFVLLKAVLVIVLFFNMKESVLNCKRNYRYRYSAGIYYWTGDYRPYFDLEKRMREAGIKRSDLTISGFDDTFCSSLYLMNQIGAPIASWDDANKIKEMLTYKDTKYLVINDSARFNKLYPNDFARDIVLTHRGLIVYRIRH